MVFESKSGSSIILVMGVKHEHAAVILFNRLPEHDAGEIGFTFSGSRRYQHMVAEHISSLQEYRHINDIAA